MLSRLTGLTAMDGSAVKFVIVPGSPGQFASGEGPLSVIGADSPAALDATPLKAATTAALATTTPARLIRPSLIRFTLHSPIWVWTSTAAENHRLMGGLALTCDNSSDMIRRQSSNDKPRHVGTVTGVAETRMSGSITSSSRTPTPMSA